MKNHNPYTPYPDGFYPRLRELREKAEAWRRGGNSFDPAHVSAIISADNSGFVTPREFAALLSPAAEGLLEAMARRGQAETLRNFGRTVQLFTPLYLANFCTNRCVYCGFSTRRDIMRRKLSLTEVRAEGEAIAATGLRKILLLTGDAPRITGADYLSDCISVISGLFPSVGIEVPAYAAGDYARFAQAGADSMTMFQETYDPRLYAELHPGGPKRDFAWRLDAPQRALEGGLRAVNLGALLGLANWREDIFYTGMHARWLSRRYPEAEISVSLPRMNSHAEGGELPFTPLPVSEAALVQAMLALRCFLPQIGITLSTRENAALRDNLIPLGVTRVSAGVCTAVGGHGQESGGEDTPQFDISDPRSVDEMCAAITKLGYQPVLADWLLPAGGQLELSPGLRRALGEKNA